MANYLIVSAGISIAVAAVIWMFVEYVLHLGYLGVFAGPLLGFIVAGLLFAALAKRPSLFGADVPAGTAISPAEKEQAGAVLVLVAFLVAISNVVMVAQKGDREQKNVPAPAHLNVPATVPQLSGTLTIAAGDTSRLILPLDGHHLEMTGFGRFKVHNVRENGSKCISGEKGCISGPRLKGYHVSNESEKGNIFTFVLKPD